LALCRARKESALRSITMYRVQAGMTQQKLADAVGVTQASINRYEKGERTPGPAVMR
jgi:DNA-binding XRE family transcriptional regulator